MAFPRSPLSPHGYQRSKKVVAHELGFCSMRQLRVLLHPLDRMLVHRTVTPSSMSPVPIYTPGWRETMRGKVVCLRKQHDGRDWTSSHLPASDLTSNALTSTQPRPQGCGPGGLLPRGTK